jgi:hypothetical protein
VRLGDGVGAVDSLGFIGLPTPQGHAKIALQRMRVCCCVGWEEKFGFSRYFPLSKHNMMQFSYDSLNFREINLLGPKLDRG